MSDELETTLREALTGRAEFGMSHTDTERELRRLQARIHRDRGRRRLRLGLVAAAAAATIGGAVALVVTLGGGDNKATVTNHGTPTTPPTPSTPSTAPPTVPAGFPVGTWAKVHQQFHETLAFSDVAAVTLHDQRGQSEEHLTFPAPGQMTFDAGDDAFCITSGTYRYRIVKHRLFFTLVGKDGCQSRIDYLTGSAWTSTG